jgi:hypothetical protein
MATPDVPEATDLCTEGLKRAGYSSPSATQLTQAADWLEEIKQEIWLLGKKLKPLMAEHVEVLTGGIARYDFPDAFSSILSARILIGDEALDVTGTAAATVTLDDEDEGGGEDEIEGKEILIYSGTGKGSMSMCYSYDEDTYIASVSPTWASAVNATAPEVDDTYVIIDEYRPLDLLSVSYHDESTIPNDKGPPRTLYQVGDDTHYGYYILSPIPDDDYYYGLHLRYYLNLMTLDLTSDRLATLYQRWRNLWIQGVKARQLESDDDDRAAVEVAKYLSMLKDTVALESYGRQIRQHYTKIRA